MYILVLPKLLLSKRFYYILIQPAFRSHISLVVINKYYLVINWGKSFWLYYIQLFKVRSLLNLIVLWFAYTVILNKEMYIKVIKLVGFYWSIINFKYIDINQPILSIIGGYIKRRDKNNYKVLFFIIKEAFKEVVIKEDYISIAFNQISIGSSKISVLSS